MMMMMATTPAGFRSPQTHHRSFYLRRISLSFSNNHQFLFHPPCGHIFSGGGNGSNGGRRFGGGSDGEGAPKNNYRYGFRPPRFSEEEYYFCTGTPGSIIRFTDQGSYNEYVGRYYNNYWIVWCYALFLIAIGIVSRKLEEEELKKANELKQDHSIKGNN